jgi:hypothetical protein
MRTNRLLPLLAVLLLAACQKRNYDCTCYQPGKEAEASRYKMRAGDRKSAIKDCQYQALKLNTTNAAYMCQLVD